MKKLFNKLNSTLKTKFKNCQLLVMDFDGVLTNDMVYFDKHGSEYVQGRRSDGFGLKMLRETAGIKMTVLSQEANAVGRVRAKKMEVPYMHAENTAEKLKKLTKLVKSLGLPWDNVCYIGNDINDLACIKKVGIGVAVADAYDQVLDAADYTTERKGGAGAVREVCELILYAKGIHPYP